MSDLGCYVCGKFVSCNSYVSKTGEERYVLSVSDGSNVFEILGSGGLPAYDFGVDLVVLCDVRFFNGKPSSFVARKVSINK